MGYIVNKSFSPAIPSLCFFHHTGGIKGISEGEPFGIKGIDLYGEIRHSSARALRKHRTPEEIKRAAMSETNKAFEHYFQIEAEDLRDIYRNTGNIVRLGKIDNKNEMLVMQ